MLRGEHRAPVADDLAQEVRDGFGPQRVELRRGLVDDEDGRVHRHDACDRHPLLLPAGERERLPIGEVRDAQPFEHGIDPAVHLVAWDGEVLEAEGELLPDRGLGGGQLVRRRREHDADLAQPIRRAGGRRVDAGDMQRPVDLGTHDPWDECGARQREGRLAGAGRPGDPQQLARPNGEGDVAERGGGAPDVSDAQRGGLDPAVGRVVPVADRVRRLRHSRNGFVMAATMTATNPRSSRRRSTRSAGGSTTSR